VSDASVRAALRSDEKFVVVEAPAACGKTHQGADYAREVAALANGRLLILTHTREAVAKGNAPAIAAGKSVTGGLGARAPKS
jgi:superfamily II DNA or RNA helicase